MHIVVKQGKFYATPLADKHGNPKLHPDQPGFWSRKEAEDWYNEQMALSMVPAEPEAIEGQAVEVPAAEQQAEGQSPDLTVGDIETTQPEQTPPMNNEVQEGGQGTNS